ncbi:HPP family protein [Oxalobacteraceae bacterium OM1]|nr:HPP family protein [Oxalobacteraceae bacterium OM1]
MQHDTTNGLAAWLRGFRPVPVNAGRREKLAGCLGACLGLLITQAVCRFTFGELNPWFIAPMGASAVLLFAVPSSPLAQPWSIIGGNVVSALIGITCAKLIGEPMLACAVAVMLAIAAMFALQCLHPPSGAVALTAILGGPAVVESGYRFALLPVGANSALLLVTALVLNNLLRRRYPHPVVVHINTHRTSDPRPEDRVGVTREDVDEALREHAEPLDIAPDDLEDIVLLAEERAWRRHAGDLRCREVMSKDVLSVAADLPPEAAWEVIEGHHVKALPVVDARGVLIGIVSLHDLIAQQRPAQGGTIGRIMSRDVVAAHPEQSIPALVRLFNESGHHHLPVVDATRKVVGMVTQSDLVAALYRAGVERAAA